VFAFAGMPAITLRVTGKRPHRIALGVDHPTGTCPKFGRNSIN
jgi:hypothetical protein